MRGSSHHGYHLTHLRAFGFARAIAATHGAADRDVIGREQQHGVDRIEPKSASDYGH